MRSHKSVLFVVHALLSSFVGMSAKADTICYSVLNCIPACYTDEWGQEICEEICGYQIVCTEEGEGDDPGGIDPCLMNGTKPNKNLCDLQQ